MTGWFTREGVCEEVTVMVSGAGLTACVTVPELVVKFVSPLYFAVIVYGALEVAAVGSDSRHVDTPVALVTGAAEQRETDAPPFRT